MWSLQSTLQTAVKNMHVQHSLRERIKQSKICKKNAFSNYDIQLLAALYFLSSFTQISELNRNFNLKPKQGRI